LVHGDAINPSNILVQDKNKIKLLDWEWSVAADPAWEFCDLGWWPLNNMQTMSDYFEASGIKTSLKQKEFLNRIKLYIPLWLLWGTYMHANDSKSDIYIALRKLLLKEVKNY
jgi:thiamine kinase-like enzyme